VDRIAPPLAQQVASRGPAWIDSAPISAPYGFAAEVHAARSKRAAHEPHRGPSLAANELANRDREERRIVGERIARDRGLRFVADPPMRYRGVLLEASDSGRRQYVAVVDERTRTVTVVARAQVPAGPAGGAVEILRGADGGLVIKRRDLAKDA
jgi:hypothetical protein